LIPAKRDICNDTIILLLNIKVDGRVRQLVEQKSQRSVNG